MFMDMVGDLKDNIYMIIRSCNFTSGIISSDGWIYVCKDLLMYISLFPMKQTCSATRKCFSSIQGHFRLHMYFSNLEEQMPGANTWRLPMVHSKQWRFHYPLRFSLWSLKQQLAHRWQTDCYIHNSCRKMYSQSAC